MKIAVIPVRGRLQLLPYTIKQALKVVDKVICITSKVYERAYCPGAETANLSSRPLSDRWNYGFQIAKEYDPDHILFIGSSDWVSENWMDKLLPYTEHYDIVGVRGFNLLHLNYELMDDRHTLDKIRTKAGVFDLPARFRDKKLGEWTGYDNFRTGEPIGIGRILNRCFLKRVEYKPFRSGLGRGLDYDMILRTQHFKIAEEDVRCLSISTNLWGNLHSFDDSDEIKDNEFLDKWFPDANELCQWRTVKLTNQEI